MIVIGHTLPYILSVNSPHRSRMLYQADLRVKREYGVVEMGKCETVSVARAQTHKILSGAHNHPAQVQPFIICIFAFTGKPVNCGVSGG